jgi:hypothetical protein
VTALNYFRKIQYLQGEVASWIPSCCIAISRTNLTAWHRVFPEKLTVPQPVKKFPAFYGTLRFIIAFKRARHLSLSWATSIQSLPHPISWRYILILSFHLCLGLPGGLLPSGLPYRNFVCTAPVSHKSIWPAHLIVLPVNLTGLLVLRLSCTNASSVDKCKFVYSWINSVKIDFLLWLNVGTVNEKMLGNTTVLLLLHYSGLENELLVASGKLDTKIIPPFVSRLIIINLLI